MKTLLLFIGFTLHALSSYSQQQFNNWYFGYFAGITFNTNPPSALPNSAMWANEGSATISDNNGMLLFYTNGMEIWDRNHMLMPNGTGLNGSLTCTQSALVIPKPGASGIYYVFTPPDQFSSAGPFCYSIVDMSLNNGFGDITNKNTPLFFSSTEKVTAMPHANGTDIWVIGHGYSNADFYAFQLTASGILPLPVISTAGTPQNGTMEQTLGTMKASPCGDKIALVVHSSYLELFDFDQFTGIVSNPVRLTTCTSLNAWGLYSAEFSPDGTKLYSVEEHPSVVVQFDLMAGNTTAVIASADTIVYRMWHYFGALQNGPDGKMYISRFNTAPNFISCINNPNNLGSACNFIDTAMVINQFATHGLPYIMSSFFCSSGHTGYIENYSILEVEITPNPTNGNIKISFTPQSDDNTIIDISDAFGRIVYTETHQVSPTFTEIKMNLEKFNTGMYFVKINLGNLKTVKKIIKY